MGKTNGFTKLLCFENASTNQMIKSLNIAKGSFYNYIYSKEKLYTYIFDRIYYETYEVQNDPAIYKTDDLFDRVEELIRFAMEYCRSHPHEWEMLLRAELDTASTFYPIMLKLKKKHSEKTYPVIFGNINWEQYSISSKDDIIALFVWLVQGIQEDLRKKVNYKTPADEYEKMMNERIRLYKGALTNGIYK